jgi:lactoylglutathione lyase
MELETSVDPKTTCKNNVQQVVPFFRVSNMENSIRYYVNGLGFEMTKNWIPKDKIEWCWLQLGDAALMLQTFRKMPEQKVGIGVSICFQCQDALQIYCDVTARGIEARRPFVGNALWVTGLTDPDGYMIEFASPTDMPEETEYSE